MGMMSLPSRLHFLSVITLAGFAGLAPGCGDDDAGSEYPYAKNSALLVEGDGRETSVGAEPDACITHKRNACIKTAEHCGRGFTAVDLHLDADGNVLAAVCYPTESYAVEALDRTDGRGMKVDNNEVVALDAADDGVDLEGGLTAEGNNAVIYGRGPEVSVVGGDVDLRGNNVVLRGVRVEGGVSLSLNNGSLSTCVVRGDLVVDGNNVIIAGCDVFGSITVRGNNSALANNRVQGGITVTGNNTRCAGNVAFADADADALVDEGERGAAIECGGDTKKD
jgi:hypothetical protein